MTHRLYVVGIRWIKTPLNVVAVDTVLGADGGDWYRLNGYTWLSFTTRTAVELYHTLGPLFKPEDSIMILKADPSEYQGWCPKELWTWLAAKQQLIQSSN